LYHIQLGNHEQALACTQHALAAFRQLSDRRGEASGEDCSSNGPCAV
jgi:hypothetical protein